MFGLCGSQRHLCPRNLRTMRREREEGEQILHLLQGMQSGLVRARSVEAALPIRNVAKQETSIREVHFDESNEILGTTPSSKGGLLPSWDLRGNS